MPKGLPIPNVNVVPFHIQEKMIKFVIAMTKKRRGGKKLHFTKTGQPYVLLASGQARFVKR